MFDLPGMAQDYVAFLREDGSEAFFTADAGVLMMRTRDLPWHAVADLSVHGLSGITRLAISPDLTRLAIVADDPAGE